eukprot:353443-Alexandrium_andersonii.AAC.1
MSPRNCLSPAGRSGSDSAALPRLGKGTVKRRPWRPLPLQGSCNDWSEDLALALAARGLIGARAGVRATS